MKYKVGVWGQYGDGGVIADGQAVRTTIITSELEQRYGKSRVTRVNTNSWRTHPIGLFIKSVGLIANSENVVILPADNGFKIIVPLLTTINSLLHRKLLYIVIGGFLPKLLKDNPIYISKLKKFNALFVQTKNIKVDLERLGLDNIHYITNLKRTNPVEESSLVVNTNDEVAVCLFSRITEDKGVLDAVEAVKRVNQLLGGTKVKIEIYGIIADNFKEVFNKTLVDCSDFVRYNGVAQYDKTVNVLKGYFALLFPTYFHGEGFPGCFIDAFNAGLPIIATDWLYNKDLIIPGENGLLVPVKDPDAIAEAILKLYNNRELTRTMAINSLRKSKEYEPEKVLAELFNVIASN